MRLEDVLDARVLLNVRQHYIKGVGQVRVQNSCDYQFAGSLSGVDLFDQKDWLGFSDLATVFADHAENLSRVLRTAGLFDSALFELSIKEPLVDLDPGEASLRHGLFTDFAVKFPVVLLIKVSENFDLIIGLALAVGAAFGGETG